MIADEPTAALDAWAEEAVFGTVRGRSGAGAERLTLLVNVRYADQILVLEHGRLIGHGRHDELMALHGTYFELFSLQASRRDRRFRMHGTQFSSHQGALPHEIPQ